MKALRFLLLAALAVAAGPAWGQWKAVERDEFYTIAGSTGPELYASIGERGPKAGIGRAIAFTVFKLTWTRNYRNRGGACVLASAVPKLTITTRLPKPAARLPPTVRQNWDTFLAGVRAHEKVHARLIVEMVEKIEAATVGLAVADDPDCRKIHAEMTKRLSALSLEQRGKSRDFDRSELRDGGTVHRLVLALVNGG